jgi:hypothetical protein
MPKGTLLSPGREARIRINKSRKQEQELADKVMGRRTPGSGNQWHTKLDVQTKQLAIESKRTDTGRYTLKATELRRYRIQAAAEGKRFLLQVDLSGDSRDRYILVPLEDFNQEE